MQEEIRRLYNKEDEVMLVQGQGFHDALVDDQAQFTAAFSVATTAATAAFQAALNAANALPLDNEVMDNVQVLTEDVAAQVVLGREALRQLDDYAVEAYPNDLRRQRQFGQDDWDAAYNDTEKMRNSLEQAYHESGLAPAQAALVQAGYTPAMRASLNTIATAIATNQKLQKSGLRRRPISTEDRIAAYNGIWTTMQTIHRRAQRVWVNDFARRAQYDLYPGGGAPAEDAVSITVYKAGTTAPVNGATVKLSNTSITPDTTNSEGKVTFTSSTFPDLLDVQIVDPVLGTGTYTGLAFVQGGGNVFVVEVPH